jgi:hypothetical protein
MNNTTIINPINTKLQISSTSNDSLGSGLKIFQVNPTPMAEIHTGNVFNSIGGVKYLTIDRGTQIGQAQFCIPPLRSIYVWDVHTNTDGLIRTVTITGVDFQNNEVSEDVITNGTTRVQTQTPFKMVNDMNIKGGGTLTTQVIYCRPQDGLPQDQRVEISGTYKYNPFFMCSNKNGRTRKARLRSINSLNLTTGNSTITLHVFNNNVSLGSDRRGLLNQKFAMYNVSFVRSLHGITFSEDGVVELLPGELAVFYREGGSTGSTGINFTWSYYYTS